MRISTPRPLIYCHCELPAKSRRTKQSMIGKELGKYKILAEIGRGGMGIVYKAYQTSLNREVALKTLPPALSIDKNLVDRFHREAESAARLSHPNIVQIFDINEVDGIHFFAMEYLKGQTLTQKMEKEAPLPVKEAITSKKRESAIKI